MTPLRKYKTILSFHVDMPKEIIVQYLTGKVKHYNIAGDTIQIALNPTFFNATAGRGFINVSIQPNAEGTSSTVQVEVVPTSMTKESLWILSCILLVWTIVALLIFFSFNSLLTVVAGWAIFAVTIHLIQRLNHGKLENYISALIAEMKHLKKTSIA